MSQIYLAINYGTYEGWKLTPYDLAAEAMQAVKDGEGYGQEWKILKELDIKIAEEEDEKEATYKLSDKDLSTIVDSLDDTAGFLIKESTLRYWIERIVNEDRERR